MNLPLIRPITSAAELECLVNAAQADDHAVIGASHLVEKSGEIVGYFGFGTVQLTPGWLHTKKLHGRESAHVLNTAEALLRHAGHKYCLLATIHGSPMAKLLEAMGAKPLEKQLIMMKGL